MAKKKQIKEDIQSIPYTDDISEPEGGEQIMYSLEFFRKQGKRGGDLGGKAGGEASAAALTPEERSEKARKAVQARWAKYKKEKKKNE